MAGPGNRGMNFPQQQGRSDTGRQMSSTGGQGGHQGGQTGQSTAEGVLGTIKETAQDWASSAAETAGSAWEATRHGAQQFASQAGDVWDDFGGLIRRYPVPALLIGVGIGFLLAQAFTLGGSHERRY